MQTMVTSLHTFLSEIGDLKKKLKDSPIDFKRAPQPGKLKIAVDSFIE